VVMLWAVNLQLVHTSTATGAVESSEGSAKRRLTVKDVVVSLLAVVPAMLQVRLQLFERYTSTTLHYL
jgi:hypothetical protein